MISTLQIATNSDADADVIVSLLSAMQDEVKELQLDKKIVKESILRALNEHVYWFLFKDENDVVFGTCYLQSVHNYWSQGKRYYLGGFYISPSHRKQGRFREINHLLKNWVIEHDGVQIYCHIHEDNEHSLGAFGAVDMKPTEYCLCAHHWD
jgi:RimJ/RimL family protein N-acetyltransferase